MGKVNYGGKTELLQKAGVNLKFPELENGVLYHIFKVNWLLIADNQAVKSIDKPMSVFTATPVC